MKEDPYELTKTGIKVIQKTYSQVAAIMAEFSQSEKLLKKALIQGHGIDIDALKQVTPDPMLFFVISEIQMGALHEHNIDNPTFMQLLGSAEVIGTTEEDAVARFRILKA